MSNLLIIGVDNICPITQNVCDDECCPPGAVCNLSVGTEISDCDPETTAFCKGCNQMTGPDITNGCENERLPNCAWNIK